MGNKVMFEKFGSVLETEVLDQQQMNALEAGGSCESGCKKSCKMGNQNHYREVNINSPKDITSTEDCAKML